MASTNSTWLVGLRCLSQYNKGDLASANCYVSIVPYWVNSYGDMVWNQSLFGGKSLIANMVMIFVSGLQRGARDLCGGALELY